MPLLESRGHVYKLYTLIRLMLGLINLMIKSFFSERVVNVWNFLPADTVSCHYDYAMIAFKRTVKRIG